MSGMFLFANSQQRPSQRSFASVMNEIKQKQAAHDKMIQQIKQNTPSNGVSQNGNIQLQPASNAARQGATQQSTQNSQRTNQQPINNKPINQQSPSSSKIKKE